MVEIIKHKDNSKFYANLIVILSLISLLSSFTQGSSCFLPGTLITMGDGSQIPIEKVKVGDKIISYDKNMKPLVTEVLETENPVRDDYYIITFENGKELKVTNEHPLYIKSGKYEGWGSIIPEETLEDSKIVTKNIEVNDYLLDINKKWIQIKKIEHIKEKVQTYNLKRVDKTDTFFAEGFLAHNKGGGDENPPPPPPCLIKKAGCYNTQDQLFSFGELLPTEFGYYHPEDSCIRTGGCDCRGLPEDVTEQTNGDDSASACSCIIGAQYDTKGKCCGDDSSDCGRINTGILCSIDANSNAQWLPSLPNVGDIRYVGCAGVEYLSDGINWIICSSTFWRKTIGNNEFICIGRGKESIVDCCGDNSCKSRSDGKRLLTGQSTNPANFQNEAPPSTTSSPLGICVATNPTGASSCGSGSTDVNCVCVYSDTVKESFQDCVDVPTTDPDTGATIITHQCSTTKYRCASTQGLPCGGQDSIQCPSGSFCKFNTITPTGSVIKNIKNIITGKAVSTGDSKTYYCRSDGKFVNDLDTPDSQIGDTVLNSKNQRTCSAAGFTWTGTKCCSEADDINEYYNDPDGTGGCWNKKPVISINFVDEPNNSIVNFKGAFHHCRSCCTISVYDTMELLDSHTGGPLLEVDEYCSNDPENNYYCSFAGKWLPTNGADKTHLAYAPIQMQNAEKTADCCANDECWNGDTCVANQANSPLSQPFNGFRCIDGQWTQSGVKSTPDNSANGFCPKDSQCLINAFGTNASTQCVEDGSYFNDNYCENGNWSSRTKLLALKLLELKSGDYTLFCDSRNNTLNNLQYLTGSGELVSNVLEGLQTNNFCIIKIGNIVIVATSINKNVEDISRSALSTLGITSCNDALIDDGQFHSCDSSNKVWLNKAQKSFIYSASPINVPSDQSLLSLFENFLGNPIKSVIDSIKRLITNPPFDQSYVKSITKFDKLYLTQQGTKSITGSLGGNTIKNVVIQYTGFDTDICKFVDQFNQAKKDFSSGVSCRKEDNNYFVLAQGGQFSNINPNLIWLDLTSKLRLK